VRLDGDEIAADADDGDAGHTSGHTWGHVESLDQFRPRGMRWAGVALLAMVLSACSANTDILEASTQGDERTLNLIVDSCNADLTTEVEESRSRVVVTVKARNDTSDDCLDGVVVHLDQPLGDRRLLDGGTGGLVPVKRDDP
jgi:hypothetical protein